MYTTIKSSDVSSGVQEGDVFVNTGIWEDLYQSLHKPRLDPVITGFNANIDRVIQLTPDLLRSFEQHAVPGFDAILPQLKQSMRYSAANEVFINQPSAYLELAESFSRSGTLSLGGQAGIAAVHLRSLGVPSITCAVPRGRPRDMCPAEECRSYPPDV